LIDSIKVGKVVSIVKEVQVDTVYQPLKIVLIGGNGFIGNAIYKELKSFNFEIIPTSRNINSLDSDFIEFDLFNENTWKVLLHEIQPDIVICTAWETEHSTYWQKNSNFDYAKAIIKFATACFSATINHFICLGSCSEYGFSPGKCNSITTPFNPQNPYSESKVFASAELHAIANKYGKKANWIRLFQPYGLKENPLRLIPSLIMNMSQGKVININTPNDMLDFTHISDVAAAIRLIVMGNYNFSINIGTGIATSISNLTYMLSDILNFSTKKISFNNSSSQLSRSVYVDAQSDIFLGIWRPKYDLYSGLLTLITRG